MREPRTRPILLACLVIGACAGLVGCGTDSTVSPDKISQDPHASGDNQFAAYGEILPKPLKVVVEGQVRRGLLGGKGSRRPASGTDVTFEILNPESGALFVENDAARLVQATRHGGTGEVQVRLGTQPGDVYVSASIETENGMKSVEFRAAAGIEPFMSAKETHTGGTIEEVGVALTGPTGDPAGGVPVCFHVAGNGHKATVGGQALVRTETDSEGRAVTSWRLGDEMQRYSMSVEILDDRAGVPEDRRFHAHAIEFTAMATDKRAIAVQLFGGLAVFIYGMRLMSGGLRRMADRRLKAILQAMTRNRFAATAVGTILTALVQSSSATTVMTVGFVNAGLITLMQAIGVVYGANIGTTVTGQIIAFKLDALAYPSIAVGLVIAMASRRTFYKALGEALLGFGLLFLGMTTMSGILKPLRHSPEFVSLFQIFDCTPEAGGLVKPFPALMCIVIGTAATVLIQSSSATVGLVLALSGQGLLTFYTAMPLVLGDNIGTTITAVFASLGANRNAKRAALAHTLFNVIGTLYMYVLLFVPLWGGQPFFLGFINWITPGDALAAFPENLPRHVANAHTFFNVFNVVLFLPFVPVMARIVQRVIPMTAVDEERVLRYLEPRLLESPTLAVQQAVNEVTYMLRRGQKSIAESLEFFHNGGRGLRESIQEREEVIDRLQQEITSYLVELSRQQLPPAEATLMPALIHAVNDAERIGDHAENILELGLRRHDKHHALSAGATREINGLLDRLNSQFQAVYEALDKADEQAVQQVVDGESAITEYILAATEAHVARLEHGQCDILSGVIFLDLLAHLERVGDHLLNIAERAGTVIQVTKS